MSLFISDAWAEGAGGAQGQSGFESLIFLVLLFVIFYFLLLRPQMKRVKEHKKMVESLAKGDEVISNGGLLGKIRNMDDSFITLEIAKDVEVKLQKSAVASLVPKGTMKSD